MPIALGLDCGGSSCRALAVDASGSPVFRGHAGPANLATSSPAGLRRSLAKASAGAPAPQAVCAGFAGLVGQEGEATAIDLLTELFPSASLRALPDYAIALAAFPDRPDVCVLAGTGSVVCSAGPGGFVKSGGRGYLLGDAGSAFRIGRDALVAYLDQPEAASPAMTSALSEVFGMLDESSLIVKLYQSRQPARLLAHLARAVAKDAQAGHEAACAIMESSMRELAETVRRHVAKHLGDRKNLKIGLAGGLWKAAAFRQAFEHQARAAMAHLDLSFTLLDRPPVAGAAELAREALLGN
ncbi:MAG: hypothetical protein HYR64_04520 [Fimbriimonas ginsengisoli]|uniref:ATPase BadF/BadG/BcrA/BcrD type domain-containing protein n=1 Tax=Fimbriimonas ginsengisoli TaxID=1005039 RepID=A0A931LWX7_FIMGI|nr:hypothetical protein [Fimbriimonas ginsengisoli]